MKQSEGRGPNGMVWLIHITYKQAFPLWSTSLNALYLKCLNRKSDDSNIYYSAVKFDIYPSCCIVAKQIAALPTRPSNPIWTSETANHRYQPSESITSYSTITSLLSVGHSYYLFVSNTSPLEGMSNLILRATLLSCCLQFYNIWNLTLHSIDTLWGDVEVYLKIFQTMACLEVVHSMIGLVKSPWFTTFMQGIFFRLWTVHHCHYRKSIFSLTSNRS